MEQQISGAEVKPGDAVHGFTKVIRPTDPEGILLRDDAPVWVVHYPATEGRAEFWQGYRPVAKVPAGRKPWAVDNRRIGTERGFASLDAAIAAAAGVA
jgi:hypothetical protein